MHEVLVNCLGGLSLPRKSVVRLTERPDMTLDVYHGRKTTATQQQQLSFKCSPVCSHALSMSFNKNQSISTLIYIYIYILLLLLNAILDCQNPESIFLTLS